MTDVHDSTNNASRTDRKVPCPECGAPFSPRGLAGHRRLKHGVTRAKRAAEIDPDTLAQVRSTLEILVRTMDRLDARLDRLERQQENARQDKPTRVELLRSELEDVLNDIARVKTEHDDVEGDGVDAEAVRRECHRELGRLRLRQARLLFHMGPDAPGAGLYGSLERALL